MVESYNSSKTSSSPFEIRGRFGVKFLYAPQNTKVNNDHIVGSYAEDWEIEESNWKEMPHVALANIPTYDEQGKLTAKPGPGLQIDPKSVEKFVRVYGGFREAYGYAEDEETEIFDQDIAEVAKHQERLRRVWSFQGQGSESLDMYDVQCDLGWGYFSTHLFTVDMDSGRRFDQIDLRTDDLWRLIGFLFLRDFVAKKIGVCGNPDCPAPYYLKSRRHQQFCQSGSGSCTAYAQRQYALKWWRDNKKGSPAKKRGKTPRRKSR